MKNKAPQFVLAYRKGLRMYLKNAPESIIKLANELGTQALNLGLETLDLAKLHQETLISLLEESTCKDDYADRLLLANVFFAEAITAIEGNHQAAMENKKKLKLSVEKLKKRTADLSAANLALNAEIKHRQGVESSLKVSEKTTSNLLKEALLLQEDLRLLSRRLMVAQEEERKRISRELHDVIAQTLSGINLRLATLTLQANLNSKDIHQKIADTQKLVAQSVEVVHRFAQDLRPTVLDDLGLVPALKSHLESFTERSGIHAKLNVFAGIEGLNTVFSEVLFRVAQEALSNIEKHSKASNVLITIQKIKNNVQMEVYDDGIGFKLGECVRTPGTQRLGFLGMRERVEMIDGHFSVESTPGKQTTVRVNIPWSSGKDTVNPTNITLK